MRLHDITQLTCECQAAFAEQVLELLRLHDTLFRPSPDPAKVNPNGGAIALRHPTGTIIERV
ncbi:MAG: hypothetical protein AAF735_08320 [Myxococcota bacterium]